VWSSPSGGAPACEQFITAQSGRAFLHVYALCHDAPRLRCAVAEPLVSLYIETLKNLGVSVAGGRFGADMQVALVNDGPVTLVLDAPGSAAP
jgi:hypothetical protein